MLSEFPLENLSRAGVHGIPEIFKVSPYLRCEFWIVRNKHIHLLWCPHPLVADHAAPELGGHKTEI